MGKGLWRQKVAWRKLPQELTEYVGLFTKLIFKNKFLLSRKVAKRQVLMCHLPVSSNSNIFLYRGTVVSTKEPTLAHYYELNFSLYEFHNYPTNVFFPVKKKTNPGWIAHSILWN